MVMTETPLADVKLLYPRRFTDDRGSFAEIFNARTMAGHGLPTSFVQDNQSMSRRGVLRGLHYQVGRPQGKLIRVLQGHIWDVVVDMRPDSPQFGQWASFDLRPVNAAGDLEMLWVPEGFAHGFLALSETAEVLYKATDFYDPKSERTVLWSDPELAIRWPLSLLGGAAPTVSSKDAEGVAFRAAELPRRKG